MSGLAQVEWGALPGRRASPSADTGGLEREIDQRVYRLYGLTAEEIKIVEEASQ